HHRPRRHPPGAGPWHLRIAERADRTGALRCLQDVTGCAAKSLSDFGFGERRHRRLKPTACYGRCPPDPPTVPRNHRTMAIFPQGSAKKDTALPFGKDAPAPAQEAAPAVASFEPAEAPFVAAPRAAAAPQAR